MNFTEWISKFFLWFAITHVAVFWYGKPVSIVFFLVGFLLSTTLRIVRMGSIWADSREEKTPFLAQTAISMVVWITYWLSSSTFVQYLY